MPILFLELYIFAGKSLQVCRFSLVRVPFGGFSASGFSKHDIDIMYWISFKEYDKIKIRTSGFIEWFVLTNLGYAQ